MYTLEGIDMEILIFKITMIICSDNQYPFVSRNKEILCLENEII